MGNKTKYSKAIVDKICRYIESGLNNLQACQAAGICETTLRMWRKDHPDFAERVEAAREVMRSKVLAKIKAAGAKDWRAHVEFLRLAFAEYRFSNSQQVNVAIQQNMAVSDPERAELIAQLEEARARALADASEASQPLQLADAGDARAIALEAEQRLRSGAVEAPPPEPERLRERPPKTVVERAALWEERAQSRGQWREIGDTDEILDGC